MCFAIPFNASYPQALLHAALCPLAHLNRSTGAITFDYRLDALLSVLGSIKAPIDHIRFTPIVAEPIPDFPAAQSNAESSVTGR
jgi:hypothetical protein